MGAGGLGLMMAGSAMMRMGEIGAGSAILWACSMSFL
jgi:hypothetical protein